MLKFKPAFFQIPLCFINDYLKVSNVCFLWLVVFVRAVFFLTPAWITLQVDEEKEAEHLCSARLQKRM